MENYVPYKHILGSKYLGGVLVKSTFKLIFIDLTKTQSSVVGRMKRLRCVMMFRRILRRYRRIELIPTSMILEIIQLKQDLWIWNAFYYVVCMQTNINLIIT